MPYEADTKQHQLFAAAKEEDINKMAAALDEGCDINAVSEYNRTPLHLAYNSRHIEAAKFLLSRGANPNVADEYGETVLDWACTVNDKDMVVLLVESRAEINRRDFKDRTPLGEAIERRHWIIAEYLLLNGAIWSLNDYKMQLGNLCTSKRSIG